MQVINVQIKKQKYLHNNAIFLSYDLDVIDLHPIVMSFYTDFVRFFFTIDILTLQCYILPFKFILIKFSKIN